MVTWDLDRLSQCPHTFDAPRGSGAVRALFYESMPYRGRATRVFAYVGLPAGASATKKVPGVVLVHGGGGTAFEAWVLQWTARGYAAIAMDTCGCVSDEQGYNPARPQHEWAGPRGSGGFDQIDEPVEDQWMYHAVAAVIGGHSLLRSLPEVDGDRIALTGISWGAVVSCIAGVIDMRLRCVAPVYGCGFLDQCTRHADRCSGPEAAAKWFSLWNPSHWLPSMTRPIFWVAGTNDQAFDLNGIDLSCAAVAGPCGRCVRIHMAHAHGGPGEWPAEVTGFIDQHCCSGPPMIHITAAGLDASRAWCTYTGHVIRAEILFTGDSGPWQQRRWEFAEAQLDPAAQRADSPMRGRTAFLNLLDHHGRIVSTPLLAEMRGA